ncbi:MAG: sensor histidine kinase [Oscillibacter sp.]|nr:sensor histidine kinase [Oscillibacter sp.]MCI9002085.1 sensor histidine kinase [Oscillibacter sp.]
MKRSSLRTRLYVMLMSVLALSVTSIGVVVCFISYRNVMELSVQTCNQIVDKTTDELEVLFDNMHAMPVVIGRDARVQQALRLPAEEGSRHFTAEYEISAFLSEMNLFDSDIFCIYFFAENGVSAQSKYYRLRIDDLSGDGLYQEACAREETFWRPPQKGSAVSVTTSEPLIASVTPVKEIGSGSYAGMVIIELAEKLVKSRLNASIGNNGFLYICDEDGEPVVYPDGKDPKALREWSRQEEGISRNRGLTIRRTLRSCGWTVIGVVPWGDLTDNIRSIIFSTVLVCLSLLALSLLIVVRMTTHILQPINRLNQKMGQVAAGDLSVRTEITHYDEIGMLMERFNEMVRQIDRLVQQEAENQKQLRLAEFKALQAQIKPHFLYNTLDSIIWLARVNDQNGVVRMVLSLTDFLKTGLSKGEEIIPLEQEIQHTTSYLYIQSVRYQGTFVHTITLEEAVRTCLVPKLIVQPLVENAIYHGMKRKRELCHLRIWAGERDGRLAIDVEDDGAGLEPDRAAALERALRRRESGGAGKGYGVLNIDERIRMMYGEEYGVTFESERGEGTTFHITLPKRREGSA